MERAVSLSKAVRKFGGFSGLARRLSAYTGTDIPLSTCHGWHLRKKIPPWREKDIAALADEEGLDVFKKKRKPKKRRVG